MKGQPSGTGECRARPPVIDPYLTAEDAERGLLFGAFPITYHDEWCGAFEPEDADVIERQEEFK